MTDTNPSGAPIAPAADIPATAASAETPAGNFGSTRGSGLARGKRPSGAAAPTANAAKSDYKLTAVEVITHEREYKNPFASQEPASAPAPEPVKVEAPAAAAAPVPEPVVQAAPATPAVSPEPVAEKPGIQILPPAEATRPAVSWESPSASAPRREARFDDRPDRARPDHRPTFRADRREDRADGPRPEGRDPRRDQPQREPRPQLDQREPRPQFDQREPRPQFEPRPRRDNGLPGAQGAPAAEAAPKGFLAWLKGLFSGPKPVEAPVGRDSGGEPFHDGHRHRRRHRGGRGHGGQPQDDRGERSPQAGDRAPQGGDHEHRGGDRQGGNRRRRHRGGQGRDRGGEPRSEGHQGGGAI